VRFRVARVESGRTAPGGCVRRTKSNHSRRRCIRLVALPGDFTRTGSAGVNRFRFTGRLAGHKLAIGSYRLMATSTAGGKSGTTTTAAFRVIK